MMNFRPYLKFETNSLIIDLLKNSEIIILSKGLSIGGNFQWYHWKLQEFNFKMGRKFKNSAI